MSWTGALFDFSEKTSPRQMEAEIYDCLVQERGKYEPESQPLCLDTQHGPFLSRAEASQWLDAHTSLYFRKKDYGVRYYDYPALEPTKKMGDLERRIEETIQKKEQYAAKHSVKNFTANYVGCSCCGSKLNRERLTSEKCPLCKTDMRSKTTLETLDGYSKKIQELKKQLEAETNKAREKQKKKAVLMWLVDAAMYVG